MGPELGVEGLAGHGDAAIRRILRSGAGHCPSGDRAEPLRCERAWTTGRDARGVGLSRLIVTSRAFVASRCDGRRAPTHRRLNHSSSRFVILTMRAWVLAWMSRLLPM